MDLNTSRLDMHQTVAKRILLRGTALVLVVTAAAGQPRTGAASTRAASVQATGYVCVHHDRVLVVDVESRPECASSTGVPLGRLTSIGRIAALVAAQQRGGWRVSRAPLMLRGTISSAGLRVSSVTTAEPRRDRFAEAMSTIEVSDFDPGDARSKVTAPPTRDHVFAALPAFAAIAPGATVRTARHFVRGAFRYGAQIRDPMITPEQRTALRSLAGRMSIPIILIEHPALVVQSCVGVGPVGQPSGVGLVSAAEFASGANDSWRPPHTSAEAPSSACDEPTQVRIVRAPIIRWTWAGPDADTVVDASVRLG